jgi:hypothetical protein
MRKKLACFGVCFVAFSCSGIAWAQDSANGPPVTPPVGDGGEKKAPAPAEEPKSTWTDHLKIGMFADSYYMVDWNRPQNPNAAASTPHRAYAQTNGFALSFLGLDAVYEEKTFGATASLRFGPSVPRFLGPAISTSTTVTQDAAGNTTASTTADGTAVFGLENVVQAFGTWKPVEQLSLDFGQFGTIYGAEVGESYKNFNYTRGALYYLMQPFYHQGLRASLKLGEKVTVNGMVVNGVNKPIDNNKTPHVGIQLAFAPSDNFSATLGYLGAVEAKGETFAHFADLIVTASAGDFSAILNADFGQSKAEDDTKHSFYGASLAARYAFFPAFAGAIRGEYLRDPDSIFYTDITGSNYGSVSLMTATGTLEFLPIPKRKNVVIRVEHRFEQANNPIFYGKGDTDKTKKNFMATILGLVVTTD